MEQTPPARRWIKSARDLALIVLAVTAAKAAVAEPFYVPSGSMEPTLLIGDAMLATKYAYGYGTASLPSFVVLPNSGRVFGSLPKRGDTVVFRYPGDWSQSWVKRVIGLPGDRISLTRGVVSINGKPVQIRAAGAGQAESEDGSHVAAARFIETLPDKREHLILKMSKNNSLDDMPETVVPADHLFVLGDNRDNSADSRVPLLEGGVGMLPVANLIGRVDGIVASWDLGMKNQPVWTWPKGLRLSRFFSSVN